MASPQTEDGYTRIANEIIEALAQVQLSGHEWRILMVLLRKTYGWGKKADTIRQAQWIEATGLPSSRIYEALKDLEDRKIITVTHQRWHTSYQFQKDYETWQVPSATENRSSLSYGKPEVSDNECYGKPEDMCYGKPEVSATENRTLQKKERKERNMQAGAKKHAPAHVADDFLPEPKTQATILFAGPQSLRDADTLLKQSAWNIQPIEVRQAACLFLMATQLPVPIDKTTRSDWYASLKLHVDSYGVGALKALYEAATRRFRDPDHPMTLGRPGAFNTTLADLIAIKRAIADTDTARGYKLVPKPVEPDSGRL